MRLAAIASTLAIVLCVAVFGAIFWQKSSSVTAAVPAQAAAPTEGRAPGPVVTSMDSAEATPAAAAESPAAFAQYDERGQFAAPAPRTSCAMWRRRE